MGPNQDQTIQFLAFSLCLNFAPKFHLILHQMYVGQRAGHKAIYTVKGFASDLAHRHTIELLESFLESSGGADYGTCLYVMIGHDGMSCTLKEVSPLYGKVTGKKRLRARM
jgi:hypothetical protein